MQLDERKTKILQAIIRNYLETGEPVGSRTISKYTDLNLSSATIRNEMADLEELGYILQPHTSAGRIPSDKGYRLYVDEMMAEKDKEVEEMKEMLLELPNFKKPKKLHDMIIALSHKEEECDQLYLEATLKAADFSADPLTVMFWRDIYDRLEKCADACEHVGDSIETIVMKNN